MNSFNRKERKDRKDLMALFLCALCVLCGSSLPAATVTGTVQARNGQLTSTNVSFLALQRPLIVPPYVRPGWTYSTNSASDGTFSVFLHAGNYRVTFGSQLADSVIISVPDDTNSYAIGSITTNLLTFAHSVAPSTYPLMRGATSSADGASGLVLLPLAGEQALFWRGDGTWAEPPGTGGGSSGGFIDPESAGGSETFIDPEAE